MSTDTAIKADVLATEIGHVDHHDEHHHDDSDKVKFGFWVYIMSDCLLFATLFAVYAVMASGNSYGSGPHPKELFGLELVFVETMLLLVSSFTFGMAMLGAYAKDMARMKKWLITTFILGFLFLSIELYEFHHLAHEHATPQVSGYWTAFFSLVATHGIHVFTGLCWMIAMVFHFKREGFSNKNLTRLSLLSLFWHFLDVVWICVFSFVYLAGTL